LTAKKKRKMSKSFKRDPFARELEDGKYHQRVLKGKEKPTPQIEEWDESDEESENESI
jgi:hypothetical protein